MRAVLLKSFGPSTNMYIGNTVAPALKAGNVQIAVKATAVNRADLVQRIGKYPPPPGESEILGLECAGIVTDAGNSKFKVGDRVMALLSGGGYAEQVSVPHEVVMPVPESLTLAQAACVPEVFLTAHQLLTFVAQTKPNDNVLIHAAASGVGTAAIQLAKLIHSENGSANNTKIIATSTTAAKLPFCRDLGATDLICTKHENWADQVLAATNGKGVDVILDPVGASYFDGNIKAAAKDSHWVNFAFMGGHKIENLDLRKLFNKRINLSFSTLRSRELSYRGELVSSFEKNVLNRIGAHSNVNVVMDKQFNWEDVALAHDYVEANKNVGKVVILIDPKANEL